MYKMVLLDLDGTLIDSAPDLADALNILLKRNHVPTLPLDEVKGMIGNGIKKLVERGFAQANITLSEDELESKTEAMKKIYEQRLVHKTVLNPGAKETLEMLKHRQVKSVVVTNKPITMALEILKHLGVDHYMVGVYGAGLGLIPKPAPDMLFKAIEKEGYTSKDCLLVGDGIADEEAANKAKMDFALVEGGYTNKHPLQFHARFILKTLEELPAILTYTKINYSPSPHCRSNPYPNR